MHRSPGSRQIRDDQQVLRVVEVLRPLLELMRTRDVERFRRED